LDLTVGSPLISSSPPPSRMTPPSVPGWMTQPVSMFGSSSMISSTVS
jgi:hypothetical protein